MHGKATLLAAGLALASPVCSAAVSDAEFQALKEQLAALTQKLAAMEQERAQEKAQAAQQAQLLAGKPAAAGGPAWPEKIRLNGDLRYRHEQIHAESADYRTRHRFRARAGLTAAVSDHVSVGFGLASGEGDGPVSANQSLDSGFSDKGVSIDLAYFDWLALDDTHIIGGKFRNAFYRPGDFGMIWDDDLRPEGLVATYDNGMLFGAFGGLWAEESSTSGNDVIIYAAQAGLRFEVADGMTLTMGAGYFDAGDVKGEAFLYDTGDSFGNTASPGGDTYLYAYEEMEGFVELATSLFDQPVKLFVDYVKNNDADDLDTGWASGFTVGEAKVKGGWTLGYSYMDLEADAVLGVFTDSEFGDGGTDKKGHVLQGAYALTDRTNLKATYFINERGESTGTETDYDRLQLDVNFKY